MIPCKWSGVLVHQTPSLWKCGETRGSFQSIYISCLSWRNSQPSWKYWKQNALLEIWLSFTYCCWSLMRLLPARVVFSTSWMLVMIALLNAKIFLIVTVRESFLLVRINQVILNHCPERSTLCAASSSLSIKPNILCNRLRSGIKQNVSTDLCRNFLSAALLASRKSGFESLQGKVWNHWYKQQTCNIRWSFPNRTNILVYTV